MKRYQNISLCQINVVAGKDEYYLPKNSNWENQVIEKIVVVQPSPGVLVKSPIDGQELLSGNDIQNLFFNIYNQYGEQKFINLHAYHLLYINNNILEIKDKLSFDLSKINFSVPPETTGALMLYIFYNSTEAMVDEPSEQVTVRFQVPALGKISFTDIIERYMYARDKNIRAITVWNGRNYANWHTGFITLRSSDGIMAYENISTALFRPCYNPSVSGNPINSKKIPLDAIELDFNNSFIQNSNTEAEEYLITFDY